LCMNGACLSPVCMANEKNCAGAVLQHCNATFTGWVDEETCATPALCNEAAGQCDAKTCDAGEIQCTGAKLEQCNMNQTGFNLLATCASPQLCDEAGGE